jgi:hypothetical protein
LAVRQEVLRQAVRSAEPFKAELRWAVPPQGPAAARHQEERRPREREAHLRAEREPQREWELRVLPKPARRRDPLGRELFLEERPLAPERRPVARQERHRELAWHQPTSSKELRFSSNKFKRSRRKSLHFNQCSR